MTSSISIVTPPDDVYIDAIRILTFDLSVEQSKIVSDAVTKIDKTNSPIVIYMFKNGDDIQWLLDKKQKSSIILYNAESLDQTMVGYLAAQNNSYYFGTLKSLGKYKQQVTDIDSLTQLIGESDR